MTTEELENFCKKQHDLLDIKLDGRFIKMPPVWTIITTIVSTCVFIVISIVGVVNAYNTGFGEMKKDIALNFQQDKNEQIKNEQANYTQDKLIAELMAKLDRKDSIQIRNQEKIMKALGL